MDSDYLELIHGFYHVDGDVYHCGRRSNQKWKRRFKKRCSIMRSSGSRVRILTIYPQNVARHTTTIGDPIIVKLPWIAPSTPQRDPRQGRAYRCTTVPCVSEVCAVATQRRWWCHHGHDGVSNDGSRDELGGTVTPRGTRSQRSRYVIFGRCKSLGCGRDWTYDRDPTKKEWKVLMGAPGNGGNLKNILNHLRRTHCYTSPS